MPGPTPSTNPRRRNAQVAMTKLPAEGRRGRRVPDWPLVDDVRLAADAEALADQLEEVVQLLEDENLKPGPRGKAQRRHDTLLGRHKLAQRRLDHVRDLERAMWRKVWKLPQAVMWERRKDFRNVAMYVRHSVRGELGWLEDAKEARQWADRLGLTDQAMLRLRWEIVEDEVSAARAARSAITRKSTAAKARDRLKLADRAVER